jgi:hypothetical protein
MRDCGSLPFGSTLTLSLSKGEKSRAGGYYRRHGASTVCTGTEVGALRFVAT